MKQEAEKIIKKLVAIYELDMLKEEEKAYRIMEDMIPQRLYIL